MKHTLLLCLTAIGLMGGSRIQALAQDVTRTYTIHNPNKAAMADAPVEVGGVEGFRSALVTVDGVEIPCQMDDLDGDGGADHLFFLASVKGKGSVEAKVQLWRKGKPREYKARTFASLMLRNYKIKEKNKHDIYLGEFSSMRGTNPFLAIHQHGAVFESELTAFRIYCSPRQTVDIYGKRKRQLELCESEFYPDAKQLAEGFGDDVLVVGDGVGLGALNGWDGEKPTGFTDCDSRLQRVIATGPLRSIVEIVDKNWRQQPDDEPMTLTTRYTIVAGHRDCRVDATLSVPKGFEITDAMKAHRYFTGITNVKESEKLGDDKGLRGCWGTDYPVTGRDTLTHAKETVGLGIYVPQANVVKAADTPRDYGYVVSIPESTITYYISFCSDKEEQGYHSSKEWEAYLKDWSKELKQLPLQITTKGESTEQ